MDDWKRRLYDTYVSSGQGGAGAAEKTAFRVRDYPHYLTLIRKNVPDDTSLSIADLGCGHGPILFCLKHLGYRNVVGVDASPEQVDLAHRRGLDEVQCGEIGDFLRGKENAFDVIFLMDLLEHFTRDHILKLLDQVHASLRENGRVIMQVPNGEGIFGVRIFYSDMTHETCFTPRSIRHLLRVTGFRNVAVSEIRPDVHGLRSLVRYALWHALTVKDRLLLFVEGGKLNHVLSQMMSVVAEK